ncbi:YidB family protein [Pararhizobium sp. BT-229]|uniref:YidB family protein n=1 Tax=Pararhizobium sp. BT-229 TaxID=2986923 RepID=UPI0021F76719|nr:YidB family protein [Pararhizobium sp. BT-229]MCV9967471.1 YidB family protein [Pararhizobium sp. BT-229]
MSRSALTALLSVLAVAGFQNRDKIAEMLKGLSGNLQRRADPSGPSADDPANTGQSGSPGDLLGGVGRAGGLGGLGDLLGGTSGSGGILSGGLGGLLDQFSQTGHGEMAKSWVQNGPNSEIDDRTLSEALGPDVLQDIAARTGLSKEEILTRLSRDLPEAVDGLTPDGTLPVEVGDEQAEERATSVPSVKPTIV